MEYVRHNQADICGDLYHDLIDVVERDAHQDVNFHEIGKSTILPSLHIENSRNIFKLF